MFRICGCTPVRACFLFIVSYIKLILPEKASRSGEPPNVSSLFFCPWFRTRSTIGWVETGRKRCSRETVCGGKSFFESLPTPHKTSNQRRLLVVSPPPPPAPPPAPRSGSDTNASGDGSFGGRSSRDKDRLDPSPPPIPIPRSQQGPKPPVNLYRPHRHSQHFPHNHTTAAGIAALEANAMFAGNLTPGECSFQAKEAVAVGAATTAIAITPGESSHQRLHQPLLPPPPPKLRRLRLIRRKLLSRRCRQSYYSWGSGSATEVGARRPYWRGRRQASGGERRTTTLKRRRDWRSRPQA